MGFAVTGLTPFCGSAHARNGRGYKQIEAVNATVLPRGALRKFHACSAEIEKQTLHPAPYAEQHLNKTIRNILRATVTVSELAKLMGMRDHKHGRSKYFEVYARQHGTCVKYSQKSEELK